MKLVYRPDIDGLRAIAVLAVLFFHTNIPGFSGGFVGVDIFFVISGYLITSILLNDINEGTFSFARFYERRIRRIFPALFPVIAFTVVVGAYLLDQTAFQDFGKSITATTLFSSNILFWRNSGYFDTPSLQKPLLHTWSLAVEEQFYIFFPIALVFIKKYLNRKYLMWLLFAGILSLSANLFGVYNHPTATFYLVPFRAWELLVGSILALRIFPNLSSVLIRNIFSAVGMGLIIYSIICFSEKTLFPGANAIPPVLGSGLIIYAGLGKGTSPVVNKFLMSRPLVFIGLISYSLYLWHWPFIAFAKYLMFRPFNRYDSIFIILASLSMGVFSWKYFEQPFRGKQALVQGGKSLFVLSAVVMIVVSFIGSLIYFQNGMPYRYPDNGYISGSDDKQWINNYQNQKVLDELNKGKIPGVIGAIDTVPSFVLWGDSHAEALVTAVSEKAKKYKLSGYIIGHNYAPPILGVNVINDYGVNTSEYNKSVIEFIKSHKEIKTIIIASRWNAGWHMKDVSDNNHINIPYQVLLKKGIMRTYYTFTELNRKIIFISDVPQLKCDPERYLHLTKVFEKSNITPPEISVISPNIDEYQYTNKNILFNLSELAKNKNVTILHPESMFFDKNGNTIISMNNKCLYIDNNHLSTAGSHFVSPVFDDVFKIMASSK
jgi:peptidoglycan/LPS O-acetylase OafA/YrhL